MSASRYRNVAVYYRVSTGRQQMHDISLPDQRERCNEWALQQGGTVVDEFSEAVSARTDKRPQFKALMERAMAPDHPYDAVIVHSLSRMFRNAEDYLAWRNRLRRAKVKLVSITQEFGDDAGGDFAMGVLALGDEYNSRENGKHVARAMLENAKRGYSNGQTCPIGYESVEAARAGGKIKKKLAIRDDEAVLVRTVYDLYLNGDPESGASLGIAAVAALLNRRGLRYRGHSFSVSNVNFVLTNAVYRGVAYYNKRCSVTLEQRPETEWVAVPVPSIVSEEDWYAVQAKLRASNPRTTPPRVVSGPTILVGLAVCGCDSDGCDGGMVISTGKSGAYKYYACSRRQRSGATACSGRRIPMAKLDAIVMSALSERILDPSRLHELLAACLDQSDAADVSRRATLKALRTEKTTVEATLAGLYRVAAAIDGGIDAVMKTEISVARTRIAHLAGEITLVERQLGGGATRITPEMVDAFGTILRKRLSEADPLVCQSYARMLVDRVEVGRQKIRITGSKVALAKCAAAVATRPNAVPSFDRKWCARRESNPRPAV